MHICACFLCFYFLKSSELGVFVYFSICFLKREGEREKMKTRCWKGMEVGRILEELGEEKLRSEHIVRKSLFSIKMYMEKVYVCVRTCVCAHAHACKCAYCFHGK